MYGRGVIDFVLCWAALLLETKITSYDYKFLDLQTEI